MQSIGAERHDTVAYPQSSGRFGVEQEHPADGVRDSARSELKGRKL